MLIRYSFLCGFGSAEPVQKNSERPTHLTIIKIVAYYYAYSLINEDSVYDKVDYLDEAYGRDAAKMIWHLLPFYHKRV